MANRDHFVPVHHLAQFRSLNSPDGRKARAFVAFAKKDHWVEAPVKSFGWDRELYEGNAAEGLPVKDIDPAFSHPENKGLKLLNQLVDGTAPNLQSVKYDVGEYIASMAWRTPVGFSMALQGIQVGAKDMGLIRDGRPGFSEFDDAMLKGLGGLPGIGAGLPRTLHELILNRVADEIQSLALALIMMRWVIADVEPQAHFITSDQPVIWNPYHISQNPSEPFFSFGSHWERRDIKIIFPLTPTRVLWAYHDPRTGCVTRQKTALGPDAFNVGDVNREMLKFAGQFVVSPTPNFPGDDKLTEWRNFRREEIAESSADPDRPSGA